MAIKKRRLLPDFIDENENGGPDVQARSHRISPIAMAKLRYAAGTVMNLPRHRNSKK